MPPTTIANPRPSTSGFWIAVPTAAPPMTRQMTVAPTCAAEYFSPARTSTRCDVGCSTGAPVAYCLCRCPYGPYCLYPPHGFDEPSLLSPDIDTPPEIACPAGYRAAQGCRRTPKTPGSTWEPGAFVTQREVGSEAHATHVTSATSRGRGLRLGLVGHDGLGGEEQTGDRTSVLQRRAGHLHRVVDTGGEQVLVLTGLGVQALAGGQAANLLHHD